MVSRIIRSWKKLKRGMFFGPIYAMRRKRKGMDIDVDIVGAK